MSLEIVNALGMRSYRGEERDWDSWIVENCLSCPTRCIPYLCTLSFKLWHFTKLLIHICSNSGYHLNWPIWQEGSGLMPSDFSPLLSPACTCYRELQVVGNSCSWDSQRKTGNYSSRVLSIKTQWYPLVYFNERNQRVSPCGDICVSCSKQVNRAENIGVCV